MFHTPILWDLWTNYFPILLHCQAMCVYLQHIEAKLNVHYVCMLKFPFQKVKTSGSLCSMLEHMTSCMHETCDRNIICPPYGSWALRLLDHLCSSYKWSKPHIHIMLTPWNIYSEFIGGHLTLWKSQLESSLTEYQGWWTSCGLWENLTYPIQTPQQERVDRSAINMHNFLRKKNSKSIVANIYIRFLHITYA